MAPRAVPILPAVEVVRIPPVLHVRAVHEMSAIFGRRARRAAVVVAFVTDRPLPAVGQTLEVASVEDEVIDLRLPCSRVVGTDQVLPCPLVAVPVLSAVERVRKVTVS